MQRVRGIAVDDIWTNPDEKKGEDHYTDCEISSEQFIENKFIDRIADIITQLLEVNYKDRNAIKNIIKVAIAPKVDELLEQYLHGQLEMIGYSINNAFGIQGKVCYNYTIHAKLADYIQRIEQIIGKEKCKELREAARKDKELPPNKEQSQSKSQ